MRMIFLLLLFGLNANASLDNFSKKIFDLTNPSGANQISEVQDIRTKGGYSIYCAITGTLEFDSLINASNQFDVKPSVQTFTSVANSAQHMDNSGFLYDITTSNAAFVNLEIGTFTGTGTAKCYFTAKDI